MSELFLFSLLLIPPVDSFPPRSYRELQVDLRDAFRVHARAEQDREKAAAVCRMIDLYGEIVSHPNFSTSETLEGYRARLWSRLKRVQREIQIRIERERNGTRSPSTNAVIRPPARGGRAIPDYGPALVALIERTITPKFWDTNGGPGTIVYYRPLRVLVVRATDDVHHRVGGLLRAK